MKNVPAERLREQIRTVLTAWQMDDTLVRTTADVMLETDLAGVESHGVSMLWEYDQWRIPGKVNLKTTSMQRSTCSMRRQRPIQPSRCWFPVTPKR